MTTTAVAVAGARLADAVQAMLDRCSTVTEQVALLHRLAASVRDDAEATIAVLMAEAREREQRLPETVVWRVDDSARAA